MYESVTFWKALMKEWSWTDQPPIATETVGGMSRSLQPSFDHEPTSFPQSRDLWIVDHTLAALLTFRPVTYQRPLRRRHVLRGTLTRLRHARARLAGKDFIKVKHPQGPELAEMLGDWSIRAAKPSI